MWAPAVDEFLQLLARAVKQFHTYPATSSMCTDAVAACHKAFGAVGRQDRLTLRVTPHEFIADEAPFGGGTVVEHELVRRLHRAHVASIDIDRAASLRDLTHLCTDIIRCDDLGASKTTFAELLAEHGVESVVPRMAHRPEVLDVGARPGPVWDVVEHDRMRRRAAVPAGPVQYLYPPEKGWVRLAPGAAAEAVSLVDLAILVDDPSEIATMLLRLTDDDPVGPEARSRALEQKFVDVAALFSSLDVHLARVMFEKLARAVLAIEPARRKTLLQRTILPGLLDGRADGAVLRDFPDPDLAESLCLLLELETAAPEVVTAAMHRLDLPAERRKSVASLVEQRLQNPAVEAGGGARDSKIDRFARRLVRIDTAEAKSFAEFAAFDLSIDEGAAAALEAIPGAIQTTDTVLIQAECIWKLVRLEPSPVLVQAFMRRAIALLGHLQRDRRWREIADIAGRFRELASQLRESRPDVADTIVGGLAGFCTPARAVALLELHDEAGESREIAVRALEAFGESLAPAFVALLDDSTAQPKTRSLTAIMCEHAGALAGGLAGHLGRCGANATRAIVRVCGYAGSGYEPIVADRLSNADEQTVREGMRALARIGSSRAAAVVGSQIQNGSALARAAAEEALWHFPKPQMLFQLREILGKREFVVQNPAVVTRLIERASQSGAAGLDGVLEEIEALRFRFWNPGLVRVALKARELRVR